jgi:hypothetical protein
MENVVNSDPEGDWTKDWAIVGAYAKHLPTGLVVHNSESIHFDGTYQWVSSGLEGLHDGVTEAIREQAMQLWDAGRLGPVHVQPPGSKLG